MAPPAVVGFEGTVLSHEKCGQRPAAHVGQGAGCQQSLSAADTGQGQDVGGLCMLLILVKQQGARRIAEFERLRREER